MASTSLTSTLTAYSKSPLCPQAISQFPSPQLLSFNHTLKPFRGKSKSLARHNVSSILTVKAQTLDFSGSFFEGGGFGSEEDPTSVPPGQGGAATAVEDKEEPQCPPGLRQYETMMVLRPDMSEDERLSLTQKYEEVLIIICYFQSLLYAVSNHSRLFAKCLICFLFPSLILCLIYKFEIFSIHCLTPS